MSSMRRVVTLVMFSLVLGGSALGAAIPLDHNGLPQWEVRQWVDAPVMLELNDHAELQRLLDAVPIASFHREQVDVVTEGKAQHIVFRPRVTEAELAALRDAGWNPVPQRDLDREGREAVEKAWAERAESDAKDFAFPLTDYPSHAEIGTICDEIAARHPTLARTFQWGTSVQGRELWGLVVSADVTNTTAEPELRLSTTMHGDETVGIVMLLNFADYLTDHYGETGYEEITYIVDNYEIHFMPLHNPDGYVAGTRYNANSVDLNRNFLEPAGSATVQEQENVNFMNYAFNHNFVQSCNVHGGALVVNYLWDYTYTLAPDDAALIQMSLEFSTTNIPMYNGSFSQGITNGAEWYVADGTLQDWSYDQTGCIDATIEISNTKWPSASTLSGFWDDNRESFTNYVQCPRYGVNGVVTGSDTGLPLDATITVTGNSKSVVTDPMHGDYYKILDTGTYQLTYEAVGYIPQTISSVSVTWGTPTVLDVVLDPVATGEIAGVVYELGGTPIAARVDAYTHPLNQLAATVYSDAGDGSYTLSGLIYGDYRLVYSAAGHTGDEQLVTLDGATVTVPDITLNIAMEMTPFASDFEGQLLDGWTTDWTVVADGADGTSYAITDSDGGNYSSNASSACTMTDGVDLTALDEGTVGFWAKWNCEANWDGVTFDVSTDGGATWTSLETPFTDPGSGQGAQKTGSFYYEDSQASYVYNELDLDPWLSETDVRFRFQLVSDSSIQRDGFYFDEFVIEGIGEVSTGVDDTPSASTRLAGIHPNPFNPSTTVTFNLARAGHAVIGVYDVSGRLVRTLIDGEMAAGEASVQWNGRGAEGSSVASGVYFVRFSSQGVTQTGKALLMK